MFSLIKVLNCNNILVNSLSNSKVHFVNVSNILNSHTIVRKLSITSYLNKAKKKIDLDNWNRVRVRELRLNTLQRMSATDKEITKALESLRISVKEQGDFVRKLKEDNASEIEVKKAVNELLARKRLLEEKEISLLPNDTSFEKARIEDLLKRRFFIAPSFEIYGGYAGQFDLGPMGCKIKFNILDLWRNHFVIEEDLIEVDCTCVTPEPVLKASGHVERFADLMVKDEKTGECFRLDHLIKQFFEDKLKSKDEQKNKDEYDDIITKLDGYTKDEMNNILKKYDIKSPITKNELSEPLEFNLMFETMIGPSGKVKAYLRPELAQGIFVNFKRALEFNQGKLPFGSSQIGQAFRNEISPRSGLLRVREFTLAEIEYFVDPEKKEFKKFDNVKNLKVNLYSANNQMNGEQPKQITLEEAVNSNLIKNQTLGYFIGRIHEFLIKIGIDCNKLRFRQHMANEMAHYASDCWDAELLTSYGWIECVGCADRSCYDLTQHTKATRSKLVAQRLLPEPKKVKITQCVPMRQVIGKKYKGDGQLLVTYLSNLSEDELLELNSRIENEQIVKINLDDKVFEVDKDTYQIRSEEKTIHKEDIVPNVIEPSFGIGRIMYCLFEHTFKQREDKLRTYFSLPAEVAPLKCSILPLTGQEQFEPYVKQIRRELKNLNISSKVDETKDSIGKRYSRTDELSIPYGITIDQDTLKEQTVTLRERDSMEQVRVTLDELPITVLNLSTGKLEWNELKAKKGCKKKKLNSSLNDENESIGNQSKLSNKSNSNKSNSNKLNNKNQTTINKTTDQLDYQTNATSPSPNCKFNNCVNIGDQLNDQQTPIHNINTDGSIRIKTNAINRALPDIPINNDLVNTSLNSNGSAIINRSIDRSLTPPSTTSFNITNLSINQSTHSNSIVLNESNLSKFNSCLTTTTFNPLNTNNLLPLHNNLSESQSQCLNELIDDNNQSNNSKFLSSKQEQKHHSYARIKDNNVIDSSTENDTDDYYDSTIVAKRGLDLQKVTIKVPSANQSQQQNNNHQQSNLNSSLNNEPTTSLYAVSGNLNNLNRMQPNLEMPYHISNISTINNTNNNNSNFMNTTNIYTSTNNNYDLSADEEPTKEVSYNKISVREPLSKVLAERAAAAANNLIEHHYTEVYDENNSFYEEIAGSTNSSVTYTKIGDLQITNSNQNQSNQMPINIQQQQQQQRQTNSIHLPSTSPIPIETSLLTIRNSSRSTSPMQNVPILQTFLPNNNNLPQMPSTSQQQPEALYSQINKSTKKNDKKYLIAQQPPLPSNINDLYAKVQKNLKIQNHTLQDDNRKIHSSTPDMNNLILNNNSLINKEKPPPLPPFHPKTNHLFSIKSNTNLNNQETNYQHYNQLNVYPQHKRSFSSSSQYQDNDSDYYETFPTSSNITNKLLLDNHNYEVVKKKKNDNQFDKEIIDAGYEIINYATTTSKNKIDKESDEDSPCYETIPPSEPKQDEYISEPDYEIIQHKDQSSNKLINNLQDNINKLTRKDSDLADPGYEQIMRTDSEKRPKTTDFSGFNMNYSVGLNNYNNINHPNQNNESNEDYEVVNNDNHFIERL